MDFTNYTNRKLKSPSDSSLLTIYKSNIKSKTEIKRETDSDKENEEILFSKLVSNRVASENTPKSSDTLFEIPDMPSSAGSSFCRSATSSSSSVQSSTFSDGTEFQSSDVECDVCSSTLTLVSQSYAPSESTLPALRCSVPGKDDNTRLVILDSATAILQLPNSVTRYANEFVVKKTSINGDKFASSLKSPTFSKNFMQREKKHVAECKVVNPEVMPRCKMRDFMQSKHGTSTVPMYLVEMLPGQFMAFPTAMPGPLGPNTPTPTTPYPHPQLPLSQSFIPRITQPIPLYHTVLDSEKLTNNCNNRQNEINNKNDNT